MSWFTLILLFGALTVVILAACSMAMANINTEKVTTTTTETALTALPLPTLIPSPTPVVKETEEDEAWLIASSVINALMTESANGQEDRTPLQLELSRYEKVKLLEALPMGMSVMTVQICDEEGLCIKFAINLRLQEGEWRICEVRKGEVIIKGRVARGRSSTTMGPSQTVENLFDLLVEGKDSEALTLFAKKTGTSTIGITGIRQELGPLSSAYSIKVPYESTLEELKLDAILWNPGTDSREFFLWLSKGPDGEWKPVRANIGDRSF